MGIEIHGFDELSRELKKLEKNVKALEGSNQVSFGELFTNSFMKKNTDFNDIEEFLNASGFKVESEEDFDKIPENEFDKFVSNKTRFATWEDMLGTAGEEYASRKIFGD